MAAITLEVAKKHLEMWLEAESEVAINQSYTIGGKSFTRANLAEIRKQIEYWSNKVAELENLAKKRAETGYTGLYREIYRQKQPKRAEIQAKQENKRLPAIARFFVIIYKIAKHQGDIEVPKVLFLYSKYGERRLSLEFY